MFTSPFVNTTPQRHAVSAVRAHFSQAGAETGLFVRPCERDRFADSHRCQRSLRPCGDCTERGSDPTRWEQGGRTVEPHHQPTEVEPRTVGLADDPELRALADLVAAAEQMSQVCTLIREHAAQIRACRLQGLSFREIVETEHRPLIVEVLTEATSGFEAAGTRFRQAKAAALRREGMTLEEIGALFGLTRQRISRLLQDAANVALDGKPPQGQVAPGE